MAQAPHNSGGTEPSPSNDASRDGDRLHRDGEALAGTTKSADRRAAISALTTQAKDPDRAKAAVADSASTARNIWILFLSFGTYLVVAVGSVTHRQLLFEEPIRLPLLNVELPLVAFFVVAPVLFLIFHVYLLMHLKLMSDKVRHYNDLVRELELERTIENQVRLQLPDFMFVQYLAGPDEGWRSLMHWLLVAVAWLTVVFGPVIVLLLIQLQFLPYHHEWVTWAQRVIIILDIGLLWWFWPKILPASGVDHWFISAIRPATAILSLVLIAFSVFVAAFPGETLYGNRLTANLTEFYFEGVDPGGRRPAGWFSNKLILSDQRLVDADAVEKIAVRKREGGQSGPEEYAFSLSDRDLRHAVLDKADLRQVNLAGAKLRGASLFQTHLQGSSLVNAELQGASLNAASLQGTLLNNASLQGASLVGANLQGALLTDAELQGASLDYAGLQGASLNDASLQGASLVGANLQGASLDRAGLQGASLDRAGLQGASLDRANLQGASFDGTRLWRTDGTPELGSPPRIWVRDPSFQDLSAEQIAQLKKDALEWVTHEALKRIIAERLAPLSSPERDLRDSSSERYWRKLGNEVRGLEYPKDLANRLKWLACEEQGAPFVAQGLIVYSRLEAVGPSHLPNVAKHLLMATENSAADCPGVKGLSDASIAQLRKWAAKVENKADQTAE